MLVCFGHDQSGQTVVASGSQHHISGASSRPEGAFLILLYDFIIIFMLQHNLIIPYLLAALPPVITKVFSTLCDGVSVYTSGKIISLFMYNAAVLLFVGTGGANVYTIEKQRCRDRVINDFLSRSRHLLVPLLFHEVTSLHPPSFDFYTCSTYFLFGENPQ